MKKSKLIPVATLLVSMLLVIAIPARAGESYFYQGTGGFSGSFFLLGGEYSLYVYAKRPLNGPYAPESKSCLFGGNFERVSPNPKAMSLGSGITISPIVPHKIGPESLTLTAGLYHSFIPTLTTCDWKFVLNSTNQNAAGVAPVQMFKLRKGSAELSPTASVKDRVEHALAKRSGHRFLDPSVAVHRARPSFFRAFREPLRALLDGGANGRKFSSGGAKGCDEMQNLFEEDGAIEIAVQHAEIAKFPIMRIVI